MKSRKMMVLLAPVVMVLLLAAATLVNSAESYKESDMPKLMEATYSEDALAGADPEAIKSLLQRGQLIIINEHAKKLGWLVTGAVLVNAKPETIFSAISDYKNYPNFMPETEKVTATELNGPNIVDLSMVLKIKITSTIAFPIPYSIIHYHRPPYRSDWTKHTGDFEVNSGFYQFVPVDNGQRTMLFYTLHTRPRLPGIPGLKNLFQKDPNFELVLNMSTATMVTRSLKKYAEKIEKRAPFIPGKGVSGSTVDALSKDSKTVSLLLKRGGLIMLEDGPPMWATTAVAMNASPEDVFKITSTFEKFSCYQSQVQKIVVKERTEKTAKVFFDLNIDYAVISVKSKYTLGYTFNPPNSMTWKWVEGDVPSQQGSWNFVPLEGGKKTLAIYRQTEDLKTLGGTGGAMLRMTIKSEGTIEPAVLGSQALIVARSTRDTTNMPAAKRDAAWAKCPAK